MTSFGCWMDRDGRDRHPGTRDLEPLDRSLPMPIVMFPPPRPWLRLLPLTLITDPIFPKRKVRTRTVSSASVDIVVCVLVVSIHTNVKRGRFPPTNYPSTLSSSFFLDFSSCSLSFVRIVYFFVIDRETDLHSFFLSLFLSLFLSFFFFRVTTGRRPEKFLFGSFSLVLVSWTH